MAEITEAELYAELVRAHMRPPPIQPGDITIRQFAADTNTSADRARTLLEREVQSGRLERIARTAPSGRPMYVYRVVK